MSVLDTLLEGFDEARHPRGFHGRFSKGDKVRVLGRSNVVKGVHTVVGRSESQPSHLILQPPDGGPHVLAHEQHVRSAVDERAPNPSMGKAADDLMRARAGQQTRDQIAGKLKAMPVGHEYELHGGEGRIGHVKKTASGYEVHEHGKGSRKYQLAGGAAIHADKIERQGAANTVARQQARAGRGSGSGFRMLPGGESVPVKRPSERVTPRVDPTGKAVHDAVSNLAPGKAVELRGSGIRVHRTPASGFRVLADGTSLPVKSPHMAARQALSLHRQRTQESAPAGVLGALLEGAVLSERFVAQAKRDELASKGHALKVGGKVVFPIETKGDASNAATLWKSGHHKTEAARKHIVRNARRVGALGVVRDLSNASDPDADGDNDSTSAGDTDSDKG